MFAALSDIRSLMLYNELIRIYTPFEVATDLLERLRRFEELPSKIDVVLYVQNSKTSLSNLTDSRIVHLVTMTHNAIDIARILINRKTSYLIQELPGGFG